VVTHTLLGLKFPPPVADQLMPGIRNLRDSLTYQAIVEEGRIEGEARGRIAEARDTLFRLGEQRLGRADQQTRARVEAISDLVMLHDLEGRLLNVASWDELLASL
jgi:predicted transposase YdaD